MSRHFNYELDERRIKILLKENSMPYSDDVWNDYLQRTKPLTKTSKLSTFKPNVSFAISKSALLTGSFVILIGSFTVLIAKFVDFGSARSNIETVREVKPDPDNYKSEKITASLPVKEVAKPIVMPKADSSVVASQINSTVQTTQAIAVETKTNSTTPLNEETKTVKNKPDTIAPKSEKDTSSISQKSNDKSPRKKRKRQVETLESKPLTTEIPTTSSDEPELELK